MDIADVITRAGVAFRRDLFSTAQPLPATAMASPPTATSGTSSTISSPRKWAAGSGTNTPGLANGVNPYFTYLRGAPDYSVGVASGVTFNNVTLTSAPTYGSTSFGVAFIHDGLEFEIILGGNGTSFLLKVDDEYVSLTKTVIPNNSVSNYYKYAFAEAAERRIEIVGNNLRFDGVNTGQTDSLGAAVARGPKTIIIGDSFTENQPTGWTTAFADAMGRDDVWGSGDGGTGYLATSSGKKPTFRGRILRDAIAYAPDEVGIVGLVNDSSFTAAALGAEAALLFAQLREALPRAVIWAAPNWKGGVNTQTATNLDQKDAVKAAALAAGVLWLDLLEMPLAGTPLSGLMNQGYNSGQAGSTGIRVKFVPQPGSTLQIGTGATRERIEVKSFSQAAPGIYNVIFDGALQYAHVTGEPVVQVGNSFWSGSGNEGAPTGYGNSDIYVSDDDVHPSVLGYAAIGRAIARLRRMAG